jgi:hypothetical protein
MTYSNGGGRGGGGMLRENCVRIFRLVERDVNCCQLRAVYILNAGKTRRGCLLIAVCHKCSDVGASLVLCPTLLRNTLDRPRWTNANVVRESKISRDGAITKRESNRRQNDLTFMHVFTFAHLSPSNNSQYKYQSWESCHRQDGLFS